MSAYLGRVNSGRISKGGYRAVRAALRSVLPFGLRRRILNLIRGPSRAEVPATSCHFPPGKSFDVICFPIIDWGYLFQRPQQLATQFAREGHRVLYLHTTFHQSGRNAFVRKLGENIYGVRLPGPVGLNALYEGNVSHDALERSAAALEQLRHQAEIKEASCLVQLPFWARLALIARQRWGWKVVYDCMDEHSGFSTNGPMLLELENSLISGADLVTTTSRLLLEKVSEKSRRALLLPNAADFDHFSQARALQPLTGITHPIIGYYGAISEWFDVEMIRRAALARPQWQFVLIGDCFNISLKPLKRLRNVHYLGQQPYALLPGFLHQFDIACIPFLITPLTRATNPVKFYEYLSAGKPVVAAELPELEQYKAYFYPVHSAEEFVCGAEKALKEQSPDLTYSRIELARQNKWSDRYRCLARAIAEL